MVQMLERDNEVRLVAHALWVLAEKPKVGPDRFVQQAEILVQARRRQTPAASTSPLPSRHHHGRGQVEPLS